MNSWRELIKEEAKDDKIIYCTLSEEELDKKFDCDFGWAKGKPFTAWSEKYVYFPIVYDGAEWVGRAPRNPCDEATSHMGGG